MLAQEFQIIEDGMGEYWSIAGSKLDIHSVKPAGKKDFVFSKTSPLVGYGSPGTDPEAQSNYCAISDNKEIKQAWNQIELICYEEKCVHLVNGAVVLATQNSRHLVDGKAVPLTRGKLQLQSEAAEVVLQGHRDQEYREDAGSVRGILQ